jgi:hypothetical protein
VILVPFRGAPAEWQEIDALVGPPLTKSSAQVLADAGVTFGIAMGGESAFIFSLHILHPLILSCFACQEFRQRLWVMTLGEHRITLEDN